MDKFNILRDLEKRRKNIGLTSSDMAKAAGVSLRAYTYWRNQERGAPFKALVALKGLVESAEARLGIPRTDTAKRDGA